MASALFSVAAHISAVCPRHPSRASTPAPCARRALTVSGSPVRAAIISGVSPPGVAPFTSAPAAISRCAMVGVAVASPQDEAARCRACLSTRARAPAARSASSARYHRSRRPSAAPSIRPRRRRSDRHLVASSARAARESPAFTASSSVRDCPASVDPRAIERRDGNDAERRGASSRPRSHCLHSEY